MSRAITLFILVVAALLSAGCEPMIKMKKSEADALRLQITNLENENRRLTRRNSDLEAELRSTATPPESIPAEVTQATPRVSEISIGRLSHARDSDDDGRADELTVYVKSNDALGRFVQIVGNMQVQATLLPGQGSNSLIGQIRLNPAELRQAYRSGISGTHYAITVAINLPIAAAGENYTQCVTSVTFDDAHSGQTYSASSLINLTVRR